jgi:hypothetical protein
MAFGTVSAQEIGYDVKIVGVDKITLDLRLLMPEVRKALEQAIGPDADRMRDRARALASGDVLQSRTGKYVRSIQSRLRSTETSVFGYVYSDDPRIDLFEYGGSTPPRDILPNVKAALRFMGSAGAVFAAIVHRPIVQYPKRPVIHDAYDEMEKGVEHDIESAAHSIVIDHGYGR